MCRRLICVLSFVLVLSMCSDIAHGQAGLIGYWKFDEASGTTASDSSGSGNNGTLANGVAWRAGEGMSGGALFVDPADASGYCEISTVGMKASEGTLMVWGRLVDPQPTRTSYFMGHTTQPVWTNRIQFYTDSADNLLDLGLGDSHTRQTGIVDLALETWYHIALTWDTGAYVVYVNGEEMTRGTYSGLTTLYPIMDIGNDGHDQRTREEAFGGLLDEMKIFDRALAAEEIQQAMRLIPPGVASKPSPADAVTDVPRDVVLSWTPGVFAPAVNGHKVYLSENFNDVNDGIDGIAQDANSYAPPQRLDFGTTYYWRVDEVNGPPDYTVYEGSVWSFTTEPIGYPIENITATASSAHGADMGPENTINDSGLDENDLHSIEATDMWLTSSEPLGAWIEYEFDKVYKLHEMWVWNSNQTVEPLVGFGFKDVTIEYSANGTDYTTFGTTHEFARAPGAPRYAHNTTVDLGGVAAKYIRLTANSSWGGIVPQYGLSEVRFFYIPMRAREPSPDSGATGVDLDVTLGFKAGREAAQHDVYLSTDEQAVIDGTAPVATMTETSYGPLSLDLDQTYYWKVNEVNTAETPTTWQGDIWNFGTHEYLIVDDFESYNDLDTTDPESNRIYLAWVDGWEVPTNGSQVGYTEPPFVEKVIVHGGAQSMPLFYSNTGTATYSEAERTFAVPQNWTEGSIATLVLYFYGAEGNTGQLYVKINGSKVVYNGDAAGIAEPRWHEWNVELASVGTNLQNVTKLSIGIDGIGATGTLYVDDIRLYPPRGPAGPNIVWVTETCDDDLDGIQDDQAWIDWLAAEGYPLDVRIDYWLEFDAGKVYELNAADLVIVSRSATSGGYDEGDEPTLWNSVTTPLLTLNVQLARSNRWLWINSTSVSHLSASTMTALVLDHPVFDGVTLDANNQVQAVDVAVGSGLTSFITTLDVGNGILIAKSADEFPWIAEWEAGVEFYAGAGQIPGGKRMMFTAGTQEDTTAGAEKPQGAMNLTAEGQRMFLNAINYMLPAGQ